MLCVTCRRMAGLRLPNQIAAELKKMHRRRRDGLKSCIQKKRQKKMISLIFHHRFVEFFFARAMSSSYRHHHQHHLGVILTHFTLFSVLVPHRKKRYEALSVLFLQLNFSIEQQARIFFSRVLCCDSAGWEFCVNQHSKARHIFMPFYRPVTRVTFIFMRSMVRWRWRRWPARSAAAAALCDSQKRAAFFFVWENFISIH